MLDREAYIQEVATLSASSALRSRIAALPERTAPRRKVRRVLRVLAMAACAACALLAIYGAGILWSMTHRGGDLRPAPPVLTAPPSTPTPESTPEPTPTAAPITVPEGIIDENVDAPDDVLAAAVAWVRESYACYTAELRGEWQARGEEAVYDNWRIDAIDFCEQYNGLPSHPINVYRLSWRIHTTTPELGGNLAGAFSELEDGWFTPGYGCDYLVFLCTNDNRSSFLFYLMINDCEPGSDIFRSDLERELLAHIPVPHPNGSVAGDINVPDSVLHQANEYVWEQYLLAHLPQKYGVSRPTDNYFDDWQVNSLPDFDDWRIKSLRKCCEVSMEDLASGLGTAVVYRLDHELHTTTPKRLEPLLLPNQRMDENGWFTQNINGVYLVFRMVDDNIRAFLSIMPESDYDPDSQLFRDTVAQTLNSSNYILGYRMSTLAGVEIGAPLDEQPEDLLAVLMPKGEPWEGTPWHTEDPAWSICQLYTAPGIEITTTKVPPEKLRNYLQSYDINDPDARSYLLEEFGTTSLEEIYRQELDREYVTLITVTSPDYSTNIGVRVGMTRDEVDALYQSLTGGQTFYSETIFEASANISYTDDKVSKIEVYDMLGRRVGALFDI